MSDGKPAHRLPTLTEVVKIDPGLPETGAGVVDEPPPAVPDEAELVEQVLADVQRQVELMLEYRLREVLAPLLARATDALVREARNELASALREVVARAVAQELARHRGGGLPR